MKKIIIIFSIFIFSNLSAGENLKFYVNKAIENNLKLNAERKNFQSARQKKNISRSEFLPNITISGDLKETITGNHITTINGTTESSITSSENIILATKTAD